MEPSRVINPHNRIASLPLSPCAVTEKRTIVPVFQASHTSDCGRAISEFSIEQHTPDIADRPPVVEVVTFSAVMENFQKEHGHYGDTNWVAEDYITRANREIVDQHKGAWLYLELPLDSAMQVLLPPHKHDRERKYLLKKCGLNARVAAENFRLWSESDKQNNPVCVSSLSYHLEHPNEKPIFLTVEPVSSYFDYGALLDNPALTEGKLTHLDGLHRLIATALMDSPPSGVKSFVATTAKPKAINGLGVISKLGLHS